MGQRERRNHSIAGYTASATIGNTPISPTASMVQRNNSKPKISGMGSYSQAITN
tara:strand:+ start:169 stop:330 length:162 start_codon:yes stop_codon:yes gene_type:complete